MRVVFDLFVQTKCDALVSVLREKRYVKSVRSDCTSILPSGMGVHIASSANTAQLGALAVLLVTTVAVF